MRNCVLLVILLGAQFAVANNNVVVGTCKPRLKSFTTIQLAVNGVAAGGTVFVCPGTYPEQVVISQPLSLVGVADSNMDEAIITIPSGGLTTIAPSIFSENVAAQVLVQTSGVVDVTNITTDGAGGDQACVNWLAGIFYASGSSGTVAGVRARNQIDTGCGVGIWAENGGNTGEHVAILGNSVHDSDSAGIVLGATSSLKVDVRDNFVSPNAASAVDILAVGVSGDFVDNDLTNAEAGIFDLSNGLKINANGITSTQFGVIALGPATMQSNDIMNTATGVSLNVPGSTVQSNRITESSVAAIEFSCNHANVSHNTINDAAIGLSDEPSNFSGNNTFANTTTVTTDGCALAAAAAPMLNAAPLNAAPTSKSPQFLQWRTAANPNGVKQ
jgi:hypothetical protein